MAALALKAAGNRALNEGRPLEAIAKYTAALKERFDEEGGSSEESVLFSNRAVAQAKLGRFEAAAADALSAIEKDECNVKAWYRRIKYLIEASELDAADAAIAEAPESFEALTDASAGKRAAALKEPSIKHFEILEELGVGNYSTVTMARRRIDSKLFALKIIDKSEAEKIKKRHKNVDNEILMEKRALYKLRGHPNIVWLHATFVDYSHLYYCMELCRGGELWARLLVDGERAPVAESLAHSWLYELCEALDFMHSKGLVHRDVKPENMMLDEAGSVKLVDFGTAKDLVDTDLNGPEFVGTPEYMAPEMIDSKDASYEADWWAVGVVAYQLLVGHTPFRGKSPYFTFLKVRKPTTKFLNHPCLGDTMTRVVHDCVRHEPSLRARPTGLSPQSFARVAKLKDLALVAIARRQDIPLHTLSTLERARARRFLECVCSKEVDALSLAKRFYGNEDAKHLLADVASRTYMGAIYEKENSFSQPFTFALLASPDASESTGPLIRRAVSAVNKSRPSFLVVTGCLGDRVLLRKIVSDVSESIPIVYSRPKRAKDDDDDESLEDYERLFGSSFFSFWHRGARLVVLDPNLFDEQTLVEDSDDAKSTDAAAEQNGFLDAELEENTLGSHRVFVVAAVPPPDIYADQCKWARKLLKGHIDAWLCAGCSSTTSRRRSVDIHAEEIRRYLSPTEKDKKSAATVTAGRVSDDSDEEDDDEDENELSNCGKKVSVIHTSPVAGAIGEDERIPAGIALVTVFESSFSYRFHDLESVHGA